MDYSARELRTFECAHADGGVREGLQGGIDHDQT